MRWLVEPLPEEASGQRQQHDAAYGLLCRLVDGTPVLEHDDKGAPCLLEYPQLHVSISHCRAAVAVAVSSDGPVGIDIECRRKIGPSLAERVCTAAEQADIAASDDPEMAFLRLWTRKEAVLKCRGTGIKGFGSMVEALNDERMAVTDLPCDLPDVVVSLAQVVATDE